MAHRLTNHQGTHFLEPGNKILKELLEPRLLLKEKQACDSSFSDFDDVKYNVSVSKEEPHLVRISLAMRDLSKLMILTPDIQPSGYLGALYPGPACQLQEPPSGYSICLEVNIDLLPADDPAGAEALVKRISELKRNLLAGPMERAISAMLEGVSNSQKLERIQYRRYESMWVKPEADRVYVIYDVAFTDPADQVIARSFLQEFQHSSQKVNGAPFTTYSTEPPVELRGERIQQHPTCVGYIRFAVLEQHLIGEERRAKTVSSLVGFRNYLHYHIKASRTYLHIRMRRRVQSLLQILQRAVQNPLIEGASSSGKK